MGGSRWESLGGIKLKVVGITTQHEVYVGSKDRNFRINEFLIITDPYQGDLMGEVIEAKT